MSMSKRLLFDRNPLDQATWERMRRETAGNLSGFVHRLPMKRKGRGSARYWDRLWPLSVEQAVRELGFGVVRVNDGLFTREADQIARIKARAEEIYSERCSTRE